MKYNFFPQITRNQIANFLGFSNNLPAKIFSDLDVGKMSVVYSRGTKINGLITNNGLMINPIIIGVDVPIFCTPDEGKAADKTIMLVGQDPLRNINDPQLQDLNFMSTIPYTNTEMIVGTPFALHFKNFTNNQNSPKDKIFQMYKSIVDGIVKKGYNVYLTDVSKIFIHENGFKSNQSFANLIKKTVYLPECLKLLNAEFSALSKVEKCIFFGIGSYKKCEPFMNNDIAKTSIPIVHPSDTWKGKGHWDVTYGIKPTDFDTKTNYILSLIP